MKNNEKYLIVSDLDGTLLNNNGELTKNTINTIKNIIKEGHIFCIATGRPIRGTINIYNQLGLNSLLINHNGSYISNPSDPSFKPIELVFNKDIVIQILKDEKVKKIIFNSFIEVNRGIYQLNNIKDEKIRDIINKYYHIDIMNDSLINLDGDPDKLQEDVYAVLLYVNNDNVDLFDTLLYRIKNISQYLQVRMIKIPNAGFMIEINTLFSDKLMGINYLTSYYGITKDKVITFGDGDNDMKMLSGVKYGFAMKNGKETAKMSARNVTKHTNNDDGVAWDLNYFMNSEK